MENKKAVFITFILFIFSLYNRYLEFDESDNTDEIGEIGGEITINEEDPYQEEAEDIEEILVEPEVRPLPYTRLYEDFNDNSKDHNKWTEIGHLGSWWERNGRAEFEKNEDISGNQGIESYYFDIDISTLKSVKVSVDMITDIEHYGYWQWVGGVYLEITDGTTNWIKAYYSRHFDELRFIDSNDFYHTVIGECEDGQWNNEIQIYSDRYQVTMNGYESGWIYDSLFSSNIPVNIRLYISLTGSIPEFWWRAGFDNILVENY